MKVRLDQFNNDWFHPGAYLKIALSDTFQYYVYKNCFSLANID